MQKRIVRQLRLAIIIFFFRVRGVGTISFLPVVMSIDRFMMSTMSIKKLIKLAAVDGQEWLDIYNSNKKRRVTIP